MPVAQEEEGDLRVGHALFQLLDAEVIQVVVNLSHLLGLALPLTVAKFEIMQLVNTLDALNHLLLINEAAQYE